MSGIGFSAGDVVTIIRLSIRVSQFVADASASSREVQQLAEEFNRFHHFLLKLRGLLDQYGKPLPFGLHDFESTLKDCATYLEPYCERLIDRKFSVGKLWSGMDFLNSQKDVDKLRKRLAGHVSHLTLCVNYLQLELQLEANKRAAQQGAYHTVARPQLVSEAPSRPVLMAAGPGRQSAPLLLTDYSESDERDQYDVFGSSDINTQYQELLRFRSYLRSRGPAVLAGNAASAAVVAAEPAPVIYPQGRRQSDAIIIAREADFGRLCDQVDEALARAENRFMRTTIESSQHQASQGSSSVGISQSQELARIGRDMSRLPDRIADVFPHPVSSSVQRPPQQHTQQPSHLSGLDPAGGMVGSSRLEDITNRIRRVDTDTTIMNPSDTLPADMSEFRRRASSNSSLTSLEEPSRMSVYSSDTSPSIRAGSISGLSEYSLLPSADQWLLLAGKARILWVEEGRKVSAACQTMYAIRQDDRGISLRSTLRDRTNIYQHFPPAGAPIPAAVHALDQDWGVHITFPTGNTGRIIPKSRRDVQYTLYIESEYIQFQEVLYGSELQYFKGIKLIRSDRDDAECRANSLRLWRNGDLLTLLFYTNSRTSGPKCWIEESHTAFERLPASESTRDRTLCLNFSKRPKEHADSKIRKGKDVRKHSSASSSALAGEAESSLSRVGSGFSLSPAAATKDLALNSHGLRWLKIDFCATADRKAFVKLWLEYTGRIIDWA